MTEYAIEADPGKCTASFPTFDTAAEAFEAANVPAFTRDGLPAPRVLRREGLQHWVPVCGAQTWHGPCGLIKGHDLGSAFHDGRPEGHDPRCLTLVLERVYDDGTPNPCDCRILRYIDEETAKDRLLKALWARGIGGPDGRATNA